MPRGKNINLFLMDGDASGRIKCTLANWTGVAYKIPRTEIEKCKNREDLKWSGVYFLFGVSDDTGENIAYIGQAGIRKNGEGILYRLMEHKRNPDKDYWTEAVVFTTSNNSFGPTEISYLENKFCNLAIEANRYTVKNGNDPSPGHITEEKESELEEFVDYAKLIMGTLGHKIFVPLNKTAPVTEDTTDTASEEIELFFTRTIKKLNFTVEATAKQTAEGFVVLKGSKIAPSSGTDNTISSGNRKKREECKTIDDILQEDVLFNSPSSAAEFVTGKAVMGGCHGRLRKVRRCMIWKRLSQRVVDYMTYLYIYRLTSDTGLAPCVDNGLLSLACCKGGQIRNGKPIHTGLRYRVGAMGDGADYKTDDIFLLGTHKNKFLYLARVTNIVTMTEYFSKMSEGRTDDIYSFVGGKLVRNHHLWNDGVHVDEKQNIRDIAGEYVLLSEDFIYLGKDAVFDDMVDKYNARFRETKLYKGEVAELIVEECRKYRDGKKHLPTKPLKNRCGGCK